MLKYTGHPFVDVGIAAIAAHVGKRDPVTIEEADLDEIADYLTEKYCAPGPLRNFLAGAVFPNSGFAQFSYDKPHLEHKKREYADQVMRAYRADRQPLEGRQCVFCGRQAAAVATREQFPLLNSRTAINFSPQGQPGVPICGCCLLAVHAMPLGCLVSHGRLLAVHSDDWETTYWFAHRAWRQNTTLLHLQSLDKLPNYRFPRTRVVEAFVETKGKEMQWSKNRGTHSLTAYHFTNSGQSAEIEIHQLRSEAVDFLFEVARADRPIRDAWQQVVRRGWVNPDKSKGKRQKEEKQDQLLDENTDTSDWRNNVFEDVFGLPNNAQRFLRRHIWSSGSWELTRFFLGKVMHMESALVDLWLELGKRFAEYIRTTQRKNLYWAFVQKRTYGQFRRAVIHAADDYARQHKLLISPQEFIDAFEPLQDSGWSWQLARDVIALCIMQTLIQTGDQLPEGEIAPDEPSDEAEE